MKCLHIVMHKQFAKAVVSLAVPSAPKLLKESGKVIKFKMRNPEKSRKVNENVFHLRKELLARS